MSTPQPDRVRIRMYQMGFGDAFMLTFEYPEPLDDGRAERHMLVDFGSTRYAKRGFDISGVAEQIATDSNGELDVVVVTHRHKDHMSGFSSKKSGAVLDKLHPKLVVQSWTEDPQAATDATGVTRVGEQSLRFTNALVSAQALADSVHHDLLEQKKRARSFRGISNELLGAVEQQTMAVIGEDGLTNAKAYKRLAKWSKDGDCEFLCYGAKSKIPDYIPGITVDVLGPPTVDQHSEVTGARSKDKEYWMLHGQLYAQSKQTGALGAAGFKRVSKSELAVPAGPVRWLASKMQRQQINNLLRIVRELDDSLNNTSLILSIRAGDKHMLLPGDAQIENWNYSLHASDGSRGGLSAEEARELLKTVDFYKVSHHGSRNGTPRTLLQKLWGDNDDRDLVALMGTKKKVHGGSEQTAVPRETLIEALLDRTHNRLYSTASMPANEDAVIEIAAKLSGGHPFEYVGPDDIPIPEADPTTELANH
ncbi:MAG: hypothetical protein HKN44_03675 [Ilumatobacter sp.]|nr:hypothetical protein [Ilumatobacter sp.]